MKKCLTFQLKNFLKKLEKESKEKLTLKTAKNRRSVSFQVETKSF